MENMEKKPDTARKILNSAEHLFAQQGYDATCIDQIARAAGVTKGAVYYFFRNKAALFCAVADPGIDYIEQQSDLIMNRTQSNEAIAREIIDLCVDIAYDHHRLIRMMFGSRSADPEIRDMLDQRIRRILACIERILSAGMEAELIRPSNPQTLSHIFAGLIYGSAVLPGCPDRREAARAIYSLMEEGLFLPRTKGENHD